MGLQSSISINLFKTPEKSEVFIEKISKWKGVDIILGYEHPELGFLVINPKNPSSKILVDILKKNELLTIYVGIHGKEIISEKLAHDTFNAVISLIETGKANPPKEILNGKLKYIEKKNIKTQKTESVKKKETSEISTTSKRQLKMSTLVSVIVSNELFHNGNVEAWKRIIASYCAKYQNARVVIFYEGEHIANINTLFKWGKVKHGSSIQFAVISDVHKDLSKLSKYLKEGASPRFEAFLHGTPDSILPLF